MTAPDPRQVLRSMFDAAIAAAQPALCLPRHLPAAPKGRLVVIGAGKASATRLTLTNINNSRAIVIDGRPIGAP